jgi:hypothetical protein
MDPAAGETFFHLLRFHLSFVTFSLKINPLQGLLGTGT